MSDKEEIAYTFSKFFSNLVASSGITNLFHNPLWKQLLNIVVILVLALLTEVFLWFIFFFQHQ